jgi:hypothetical protein
MPCWIQSLLDWKDIYFPDLILGWLICDFRGNKHTNADFLLSQFDPIAQTRNLQELVDSLSKIAKVFNHSSTFFGSCIAFSLSELDDLRDFHNRIHLICFWTSQRLGSFGILDSVSIRCVPSASPGKADIHVAVAEAKRTTLNTSTYLQNGKTTMVRTSCLFACLFLLVCLFVSLLVCLFFFVFFWGGFFVEHGTFFQPLRLSLDH